MEMRKRTYTHRRARVQPKRMSGKDLLWLSLFLAFFIGLICGGIKGNLISGESFDRLSRNLSVYMGELKMADFDKTQIFIECLIKYGKILLIIWFLAFIPPTTLLSYFIIFAKGMSLGFTVSLMTRQFGMNGIYFSGILFLLQNLVLVPAYFFAAASGLQIGFNYLRTKQVVKKYAGTKEFSPQSMNNLEYAISLMACMACIVLASMIESYVLPTAVRIFIG